MKTEKRPPARDELQLSCPLLGATLLMACWPPEVSIASPPEPAMTTTVVSPATSRPVGNPVRDSSTVPAALSGPADAPNGPLLVAAVDAGPCGLLGTSCCAPAQACAEQLRCDAVSGLCVAAPDAEAMAVAYGIRTSPGSEQATVGGVGGEPFSAFCPSDQVLIGLRAYADDNFWGLGVHCGSLELSPSGAGYALSVLPREQFNVFGGGVSPQPPLVDFNCPAQMVVTAASWTLWQPFAEMQQIVKQLQLTCSELSVSPERELRVGPGTVVLAAGTVGESSSPTFQSCGEQGAVSGFTGRAGGAIDALSTSCVTLSVEAL